MKDNLDICNLIQQDSLKIIAKEFRKVTSDKLDYLDSLKISLRMHFNINKDRHYSDDIINFLNDSYNLDSIFDKMNNYSETLLARGFQAEKVIGDPKDNPYMAKSPGKVATWDEIAFANSTTKEAIITLALLQNRIIRMEKQYYVYCVQQSLNKNSNGRQN